MFERAHILFKRYYTFTRVIIVGLASSRRLLVPWSIDSNHVIPVFSFFFIQLSITSPYTRLCNMYNFFKKLYVPFTIFFLFTSLFYLQL